MASKEDKFEDDLYRRLEKDIYRNSWAWVRQAYEDGFIVSEHGLQAALYCALRTNLPPSIQIVAEPTWTVGGNNRRPDLVLVEDGSITDIFELKFEPHAYPNWEEDADRLRLYVESAPAPQYPVRIDPKTGKWADPLPVQTGCRLHFVAVAQYDARAVKQRPNPITNLHINHWYGRIGGEGEWDIYFA